MSQLPGTIHVKRKLVEEPLETLYIEREGFGPNVDEHSGRQVYRLVKAIKRPRLSHDSLADAFSNRSPEKLEKQLPSIITEDTSIEPQPGSVTVDAEDIQTISGNTSRTKAQRALQTRRVFHLSAPRPSSLSRASSTSSLRGLVKRRGKHGAGVAVFTEKRIKQVDQMARSITNRMPSTAEDTMTASNRPRKRPSTRSLSHQNSTTALNSSTLRTEKGDNDENLELAAELHQFSLETVPPALNKVQPVKTVAQSFNKKPMKYQPRQNPPRLAHNLDRLVADSPVQQSATSSEDHSREDVSDEWVYDVYIRDIAQPQMQSTSVPMQSDGNVSSERIGFIVIRAEDEELLEEFMSDDSDSDIARDDDEDSNAEDYYANDYPDELDSDDEWNIDQDSDQEYDLERYVMSDDEGD